MTVYGECGDCLVRLVAQGIRPRNFTIECKTAARLEVMAKRGLAVDLCTAEIFYDGRQPTDFALLKSHTEGDFDVFCTEVHFDEPGLIFCRISLHGSFGVRFVCDDGTGFYLCETVENTIQITCYERKYASPDWLDGGVFYQIFVDRFARGGNCPVRDDVIMLDDWDNGIPEYNDGRHEFKNNTFFGGTLIGAAEKLDYLASLGVTCIYLSPCFEAYSNHKYDVGDYMHVDEMFGGDEALANFVSEASKRDIAVILDGVFNHVGDHSIYFDRYKKHFGACVSKESPYYSWFDFNDYPDSYNCWWGMKNLPKVKRNREFRDFICNTVVPHYMSMGIAGWRLDVADELEADFLDELTFAVKKCRPDAVVLGEVWEDASNKIAYDERKRYFLGSQLDSVMNYPLRNGITAFCTERDAFMLKCAVRTLWQHYPPEQMRHTMNILGTHDTERILTVLGKKDVFGCGDDELARITLSYDEYQNAAKLLRLAYTVLAFLPGVPCIYYGDEIGMQGYHDPFCRLPYKWNNADGYLRKHFTQINSLRRRLKNFVLGDMSVLETDNGVFAVMYDGDDGNLLLVANMSDSACEIDQTATAPECAAVYVKNKTEDRKWLQML